MRWLVLVCLSAGCGRLLGIDDLQGPSDGAMSDAGGDGAVCAVRGVDVCGLQALSTLTLTSEPFDTDRNAFCQVVNGACVLYADSISVPAGVTARFVGSKPVILFSRTAIRVDGVVEASSYISFNPGSIIRGAGSMGAGCATVVTNGGVGAPGGSFQGRGGRGGGTSPLPGEPMAVNSPRGGCPGGDSSSGGRTSPPGGGLWLLASGEITITASGAVAANGAGGTGGDAATLGGYGGGSGGFVLLHAPRIMNAGVISANGGGGGGGGKSDDGGGDLGADGQRAATRAQGGAPVLPGGAGGAGGAALTLDGDTGMNSANASQAGSGGGGGGAGWVILEGQISGDGVQSPPSPVPI